LRRIRRLRFLSSRRLRFLTAAPHTQAGQTLRFTWPPCRDFLHTFVLCVSLLERAKEVAGAGGRYTCALCIASEGADASGAAGGAGIELHLTRGNHVDGCRGCGALWALWGRKKRHVIRTWQRRTLSAREAVRSVESVCVSSRFFLALAT